MERLQALIENYTAWTDSGKGRKNAIQVVFGTGGAEADRPEHEAFYRAVGDWVSSFEETCPDQARRLEALRLLLFAAAEREGSQAQWYLIAIQNWAKPLIAGLDRQGREALGEEYQARYPRSRRLPSQREICQMLTGKQRRRLFAFQK